MPCTNLPTRDLTWEWAQAVVLAANLAWTTLCLGGYRPETMVVTGTLTAVLLAVHAVGWLIVPGARCRQGHPAGWLFVPFLVYAAANVGWVTPVRWFGWSDFYGWAEMVAIFWVVLNGIRSERPRALVIGTLLTLGLVGVLMGCYQEFVRTDWLMLHRLQADQYAGRASGSFGIPNSFAAFLLLLLPMTAALAVRPYATAVTRVFFGWLAVIFLFGLGLTISRGAWLGLGLAVIATPLFTKQRSWRRRGGWMTLGAAAVTMLGAAAYALSPTVHERLLQMVGDRGERSRPILWQAALKLFREHPLVGSGAGSFDPAFERFRPEGFLNQPRWAHNDYLNTLSDYGVLGFGLFFGAVAVAVWYCRHNTNVRPPDSAGPRPFPGRRGAYSLDHRWVVIGQAMGVLAFALQLFVDFHLKIPALAMAVATVAGLSVAQCWPAATAPAGPPIRVRVWPAALCGAGSFWILWTVVPAFRADAWRLDARERLNGLYDTAVSAPRYATDVAVAEAELDRAIARAPGNAPAWADRAYARAQAARIPGADAVMLGRQAESDANRAIALAPALAENWIRRGVALDLQGRWDEAGSVFTHAISLSPALPLPWYHYAYHLSLHPPGHDMAVAMVATCLRLDPKNLEAVRLRQQLATGHIGP